MNEVHMNGKTCECKCHRTMPILIILFGLTFLLGNFGVIMSSTVSLIWPILVIVCGFLSMNKKSCKCC